MNDNWLERSMEKILIAVLTMVVVIVLTGVIILSLDTSYKKRNAPCSEFATWSIKDIPGRCQMYFMKGE